MQKVRFQICAKLPFLIKDQSIGNQIIEVEVEGLTAKEALKKAIEEARKQIFNDSLIFVEPLEENEKFDPQRFNNKKENLKPITFI